MYLLFPQIFNFLLQVPENALLTVEKVARSLVALAMIFANTADENKANFGREWGVLRPVCEGPFSSSRQGSCGQFC